MLSGLQAVYRYTAPIYMPIFILYILFSVVDYTLKRYGAGQSLADLLYSIADNILGATFSVPIDFLVGIIDITLFPVIILLFLLMLTRMRRVWKRNAATLAQTAKIAADFNQFVSVVVEHFPNSGERLTRANFDSLKSSIAAFIRNGAERLGKLLNNYTHEMVHVSIKSFDPETGRIVTQYRPIGDGRSDVDKTLESFDYKGNTAFSEIVDNPQVSYYVNNTLINSAKKGEYINENPEWQRYYSKTIVVPISNEMIGSKINKKSIKGFVCADSRLANFDNESCVEIMRNFALKCYSVLDVLGRIETGDDSSQKEEHGNAESHK